MTQIIDTPPPAPCCALTPYGRVLETHRLLLTCVSPERWPRECRNRYLSPISLVRDGNSAVSPTIGWKKKKAKRKRKRLHKYPILLQGGREGWIHAVPSKIQIIILHRTVHSQHPQHSPFLAASSPRHATNPGDKKEPSSVFTHSTHSPFAFHLILHTVPSSAAPTVPLIHSRRLAVKSMLSFPSHRPLPLRFAMPGRLCVSNSCRLLRNPSSSRKPTMILATPSRNDWDQKRSSFRSKAMSSRWEEGDFDVLSST